MLFSPVTAQNVFALLKASPGLILKRESGKPLNFISREIFFLGQELEGTVGQAKAKSKAGAAECFHPGSWTMNGS